MKKERGRVGEKDEAKTKVSDQCSKFSFQLCVYIGKPTHPLFQLDYVAKQAQQAVCSCRKPKVQQDRRFYPRSARSVGRLTVSNNYGLFSLLKAGGGHNSPFFVF